MVFFSIFFALALDYFKPTHMRHFFRKMVQALADRIEAGFNAGHPHQGRICWLLVMLGVVLPVWLIDRICLSVNVFLALLFNILVLCLCIGLREDNQSFSAIQLALIAGDEASAANRLAKWCGQKTEMLQAPEIARLSIEQAFLTAHRHIFGVFFWFMLPYIGLAGAVFYRLSACLAQAWPEDTDSRYAVFGQFASRAFCRIDWIPAKLTAIFFAVVGNFEDAVYAWRNFAGCWQNRNTGTLLAAGGGALGVRLGTSFQKAVGLPCINTVISEQDSAEMESQLGDVPSVLFFQHTTGLIWRALLLWLLLFLFFTIVAWLL